MTGTETIPFRPLGILKSLLENLGFQVTHCYEELLFTEHNAFLLRMEDKGEEISIFFNTDSDTEKRGEITETIKNEGVKNGLNISRLGTYQLTPNETDETLSLELRENDF